MNLMNARESIGRTNRRRRWVVTGALLGAALLPGLGWAAPGLPPAGAGAGPGARGARGADSRGTNDETRSEAARQNHERLRGEVLDQMRAMRMWKLTEELKLNQGAAASVFPILAQYDEQASEIGRERKEIRREVFEQTKSGQPNDAKMRQLIDRLLVNQQKRNALDEQRFTALRPALTPLQQAKLLLLLPRLEDEFRRRIREAMMAQHRGQDGRQDGRDGRHGHLGPPGGGRPELPPLDGRPPRRPLPPGPVPPSNK